MKNLTFVFSTILLFTSCGDLYSEQDLSEFDEEIKAYIAEKKWVCERTESGLYFQILESGDGTFIPVDAKILVTYKGQLLNSKVFDEQSAEPVVLYAKQLIEGWREALLFIEVGSSVRLIIPPHLAYKNQDIPSIPKNSILVFEMKIHGIE